MKTFIYLTRIGGGFAAPRIRNVEHGGLVTISGRSPRLLLCIHHCVSWFGAAVYLPLCICRCLSDAVYPPLCIRHCVSATVSTVLYIHYCIWCCSSTTVYPLLCICRHVYRAVYLELLLYIYRCEYVSWPGTVYLAVYLSLYIYLPWCICHCVCCVVYLPLFLPLYIYRCVSAPVHLPLWMCILIRYCVSTTVYIFATVYPPLYICHCVCCIVESDRVQRDRIIYYTKVIVYRTI